MPIVTAGACSLARQNTPFLGVDGAETVAQVFSKLPAPPSPQIARPPGEGSPPHRGARPTAFRQSHASTSKTQASQPATPSSAGPICNLTSAYTTADSLFFSCRHPRNAPLLALAILTGFFALFCPSSPPQPSSCELVAQHEGHLQSTFCHLEGLLACAMRTSAAGKIPVAGLCREYSTARS